MGIKPRSIERDVLREAIQGPVGTRISYEELAEVVGGGVRRGEPMEGFLSGALEDVRRERHEHWRRGNGGITHLSADEIIHYRGSRRIDAMRRAAKRTARDIADAPAEDTSPEAKRTADMAVTIAGVFRLFTGAAGRRKIRELTDHQGRAPSMKVLGLFVRRAGGRDETSEAVHP